MASETELCNEALQEIGVGVPIISLEQDDPAARACNRIYAKRRDGLLRSHIWNFAIERVKLGQLSSAPAFGFDNRYQLPSDWLRTISVFNNDAGVGTVEYRIERRTIHSNANELWLRYIRRVTDPNDFDLLFYEALVMRLAWALAQPIAQSNTLEKLKRDAFRVIIRQARATDAIEDWPEEIPEGSWVTARR